MRFRSHKKVRTADRSGRFWGSHRSGWATAISKGLSDEAAQTVSFLVSDNRTRRYFPPNAAVSSTGVLTFTPSANANGSATVTIYAQDNGGTSNGGIDISSSQTFTITVTAVNDAPSSPKERTSSRLKIPDYGRLITGLLPSAPGHRMNLVKQSRLFSATTTLPYSRFNPQFQPPEH